MVSVDKVYSTINSLANKDQRSSVGPSVFNSFSSVAMADIIDDIRITIKNDKLGLVYGKIEKDRLEYAKDALNYFYVIGSGLTFSTDIFLRPVNLESLEDLFYSDDKIDKLESYKHLTLLRKMGKHLSPDNEDADANIYYLVTEGGYKVFPSTVEDSITATYYRKWASPKWTYMEVNGTAVYNGSANDAQDFELPERFFDDLVYRIAIMVGINIRDDKMLQPLFGEKQIDEKENVS